MWTNVCPCRSISSMRSLRLVLCPLLLVLPLVQGCAHPVTRKLEGRWLGETVENFGEQEIAIATGWVRGTSFEFSGSALTVAIPAEEPRKGRYKVSSAHEGDILLAVTDEKGAKSKAKLTLVDEH